MNENFKLDRIQSIVLVVYFIYLDTVDILNTFSMYLSFLLENRLIYNIIMSCTIFSKVPSNTL